MAAPFGASVTPTVQTNSSNATMNRRPRAQSLQQHFGSSDKTSSSLTSAASPRDCSSSGSFVSKLFRMVESEPSTIVSWIRGAFVGWRYDRLDFDVLGSWVNFFYCGCWTLEQAARRSASWTQR